MYEIISERSRALGILSSSFFVMHFPQPYCFAQSFTRTNYEQIESNVSLLSSKIQQEHTIFRVGAFHQYEPGGMLSRTTTSNTLSGSKCSIVSIEFYTNNCSNNCSCKIPCLQCHSLIRERYSNLVAWGKYSLKFF